MAKVKNKVKSGKRARWYEGHIAIFALLLIFGAIGGTVALSAAFRWADTVAVEDAIYEVREFDCYDVHYGSQREGIKSIELIFTDGESREIRFGEDLDLTREAIDGLERGEDVELLIHPRNAHVMEVVCSGEVLYSQDESQRWMKNSSIFQFVLAGVSYCIACFGASALVIKCKRAYGDQEKSNRKSAKK